MGEDAPTDIAVLKVAGTDFPYVSFSDGPLPEVGDWVLAVGNPFGFGGTATAGIVSAHGRELGEAHVSFMQVDAPINSGNSGGPTFDLEGRVVGVNTAIISPSGGFVGIGLAVPRGPGERDRPGADQDRADQPAAISAWASSTCRRRWRPSSTCAASAGR